MIPRSVWHMFFYDVAPPLQVLKNLTIIKVCFKDIPFPEIPCWITQKSHVCCKSLHRSECVGAQLPPNRSFDSLAAYHHYLKLTVRTGNLRCRDPQKKSKLFSGWCNSPEPGVPWWWLPQLCWCLGWLSNWPRRKKSCVFDALCRCRHELGQVLWKLCRTPTPMEAVDCQQLKFNSFMLHVWNMYLHSSVHRAFVLVNYLVLTGSTGFWQTCWSLYNSFIGMAFCILTWCC